MIQDDIAADATAHPPMPDGPWAHFGDCTGNDGCGAQRGYPCVDTDGKVLPGKRLAHAHASRPIDAQPWEAGQP
jgi:hypothetical protein